MKKRSRRSSNEIRIWQNQNQKNDKMVLYTFIQFIAISPLWILGWDYSRWCFYWSSSSLILFYFDPLKNYTFHDNFSKKIESLLLIKISKSNYLILILLLGMPAFSWSLYLYNQSTSLYIMLNEITYFVKLIIWGNVLKNSWWILEN